jgi:hypothetical protein
MRVEAHRSLRSKRELWKARQYGYSGQEAEDLVAEVIADAERTRWAIYFEPEEDRGPLTLFTTHEGGTDATQDLHPGHPQSPRQDQPDSQERSQLAEEASSPGAEGHPLTGPRPEPAPEPASEARLCPGREAARTGLCPGGRTPP